MEAALLIPTPLEARLLSEVGLDVDPDSIFITGMGVVASGVLSAKWLSEQRPQRVILVGIAGSYDLQRLPLGAAATFSSVHLDGLGVAGEPPSTFSDEGWDHAELPSIGKIGDELKLEPLAGLPNAGDLLTVAQASGNEEVANARADRFPNAIAEDMEGFSVALACCANQIPLSIVRGISNATGIRDKNQWCIRQALGRVAELIQGSF